MKILIFGKTGQLARCLADVSNRCDDEFTFLDRSEADFSQPNNLAAHIEAFKPDCVINAVAYTAVDKAEEEEALVHMINAEAPANIAEACAALMIPFVHISTDFVFDGTSKTPYTEDILTSPLNVYGRSKQEGEKAILAAGGAATILRTSWVFSSYGNNFVKTMLRLSKSHDTLTIVADQLGQPTPASDLAEAVLTVSRNLMANPNKGTGLFHYSGQGITSWAGFAKAIFEIAGASTKVMEIPSSSYKQAAIRPSYSVMNCQSIIDIHGVDLKDWRIGLEDCINTLQR